MAKNDVVHTSYRIDHEVIFTTLQKQKMPRAGGFIARILLLILILIVVALMFTPWVQTASGLGKVITLNPEERPQEIHALVDGRIKEWFVRDGQRVKAGDLIVQLVDNDPLLLERLKAERNALKQKAELAEIASQTAQIDYERQDKLFKQGLASRREFEQAKIKLKEMMAKVNDAQAGLNQAETRLSRLSTQDVVAPRSGMITNLLMSGTASFVKSGERIADILPDNHSPAVEVYVTGLDAPLIHPGRQVRLIFEGWPAIQFSGWPAVAVGTFKGTVLSVDPAASLNGKFRVLIIPENNDITTWPDQSYLRFGSNVQAWILLDTVPLGFELWRQLNGFPPNNSDLAQSKLQPQPEQKK